jgi:hypothetical protein
VDKTRAQEKEGGKKEEGADGKGLVPGHAYSVLKVRDPPTRLPTQQPADLPAQSLILLLELYY